MNQPRLESTLLPDGREKLFFVNQPAMSAFPHKTIWSARDAAQMQELTTKFYRTPAALMLMVKHMLVFQGRDGHAADPNGARDAGDQLRNHLHRAQSDPDFAIVFAHDDFAQMMHAAAMTAKDELVSRHDVIAAAGVVYFRTPQDLNYLVQRPNTKPIRGLQWHFTEDGFGGPCISWFLLIDGPELKKTEDQRNVVLPEELYLYTIPYGFAITPLTLSPGDPPIPPDHYLALALLRSITAISQSQHTRSQITTITGTKKARSEKNGKHHGREVRVLSLRNPEYGRYELDAATGRRLRQHWVRGHWRNQWYASDQTNKTIWIDGFVRGNAELGTVKGQKVYVARAPQDDGVGIAEELTA
ncbi:UNVERIFIED_ORG: hypothetical protein ABIB52_000721 [Arthrobacter sp. UYCu721]